MLPAERITRRAATAGSARSVTTKTRRPLGSVLVAAVGNSNGRGAPGAGISGASFTPGGTIPEAFCGPCDVEGSDSLRDTGGGACGRANAGIAAAKKIAAISKIDRLLTRFIVAPEIFLRIAPQGSWLRGPSRRCRRNDQHRGARGLKIIFGDALDVLRSSYEVMIQLGIREVGVFSDYRGGRERDGLLL